MRHLEPGLRGPGAGQFVHFDWRGEPFHRDRTERLHVDVPLDERERLRREPDRSWRGQLLHPSGEVRRLADCRVVHPEITADRPHDHFAGVEPDADLHLDSVRPA